MRVVLSRGLRAAGVLLALVLAGCAAGPTPPPNLYPLKQRIRSYVETGAYQRELDAVAGQARRWVEERAARGGGRLAVVFDLDETLFFNWPHIRAMDFGYVPREWDRWVEEARAPAIESVRDVYRVARRLGLEVLFITGRPESARAATERNLRAIDCAEFAVLVCRPEDDSGSSAAFKTAARRRLTAEGRTIVANLGDQDSDLAGGYAERVFKLPNVFYVTE